MLSVLYCNGFVSSEKDQRNPPSSSTNFLMESGVGRGGGGEGVGVIGIPYNNLKLFFWIEGAYHEQYSCADTIMKIIENFCF